MKVKSEISFMLRIRFTNILIDFYVIICFNDQRLFVVEISTSINYLFLLAEKKRNLKHLIRRHLVSVIMAYFVWYDGFAKNSSQLGKEY